MVENLPKASELSQFRASAGIISRFKKERFLRELSEDDFRDIVIRPLYTRLGLKDGQDLCGPYEEGKDVVFLVPNPLGDDDLLVVQTKKGNMNLASKARDNLINAVAQLRTASETTVVFIGTKRKRLPSKVLLCVSGKINQAARRHIADQINDTRLQFSDSDDLIPKIDMHYPELWLDIDSEILPYMRALKGAIEQSSENIAIAELIPESKAAATDAMFVDVYLWRNVLKPRKRKGQIENEPEIIEIPITALLKKRERLILVLGDPGSGKSTSIRRLAYVLAGRALSGSTESIQIPVLLRANDLAKTPGENLIVDALEETQKLSRSNKPTFASEDLRAGRVVVLIDALDEVSSDVERATVLSKVAYFHALYPECLVIVTSREYAFLKRVKDLSRYTEYRVEAISVRQAQKLVENIGRRGGLAIESSKELIRRLETVHGMELNPLLLTWPLNRAITRHKQFWGG